MKLFLIALAGLFLFVPSLRGEETARAELAEPLRARDAAQDPEPGRIDFENYQRNIDDIFHLALMAGADGDYSVNSVIVELNRKIAGNPRDPDALMSLGHVYRILGQLTEANRFYQKALELDPDNFHSNLFSALVQAEDDAFEGALRNLEAAIRLQPAELYPWMTQGKILMLLKRDEEAAQSFRRALEIQPENRQALFALSLIEQRLKRPGEARKLLEKLHAAQPGDLFVRYHLGALELADRRPAQALVYWEPVFNEGVRDPNFLFNLSAAYKEGGQPAKAEAILNHLKFMMPRGLDIELLMADVYGQLGRLKDAESGYRAILAEEPGNLAAAVGLADLLRRSGARPEESERLVRQAAETARRHQGLSPSLGETSDRSPS